MRNAPKSWDPAKVSIQQVVFGKGEELCPPLNQSSESDPTPDAGAIFKQISTKHGWILDGILRR
jgi:hypothetical protein